MNKKMKNSKKKYEEEISESFDFTRASSATECTGLTPTPPLDSEEYESYLSIYDYKPEVTDNSKEKRR